MTVSADGRVTAPRTNRKGNSSAPVHGPPPQKKKKIIIIINKP